MGDLWRAADLAREHRGDSHVISGAVGGADAVEVLLLTASPGSTTSARAHTSAPLTIDTATQLYGAKT